ncbi:MAG: hypothetical protein KH366_21790 [Clostridiaceae bacterium]|nr:hypothetical protein [Clostridiaceae bacterium]
MGNGWRTGTEAGHLPACDFQGCRRPGQGCGSSDLFRSSAALRWIGREMEGKPLTSKSAA